MGALADSVMDGGSRIFVLADSAALNFRRKQSKQDYCRSICKIARKRSRAYSHKLSLTFLNFAVLTVFKQDIKVISGS